MKHSAEKRRETQFLSNKENEIWIHDYVDRETRLARKGVHAAGTAIMQEQDHKRNVEKGWCTTTKPGTTFGEMLKDIGEGLSDLANSKDEEDREDENDDEEDTVLGKLSEDDQPGWVIGTISKTVQHRMESVRHK